VFKRIWLVEIIFSNSLDELFCALHNSPPPADAATQKTPDSSDFPVVFSELIFKNLQPISVGA
ncbi:hypothetical protein, partial [Paraburkholderia bannensis]|uniref:hypothetical protein n=1 Tax=Paraburkholderia bannensis TaxID=765414 RepID=UPI002AB217CB